MPPLSTIRAAIQTFPPRSDLASSFEAMTAVLQVTSLVLMNVSGLCHNIANMLDMKTGMSMFHPITKGSGL